MSGERIDEDHSARRLVACARVPLHQAAKGGAGKLDGLVVCRAAVDAEKFICRRHVAINFKSAPIRRENSVGIPLKRRRIAIGRQCGDDAIAIVLDRLFQFARRKSDRKGRGGLGELAEIAPARRLRERGAAETESQLVGPKLTRLLARIDDGEFDVIRVIDVALAEAVVERRLEGNAAQIGKGQ